MSFIYLFETCGRIEIVTKSSPADAAVLNKRINSVSVFSIAHCLTAISGLFPMSCFNSDQIHTTSACSKSLLLRLHELISLTCSTLFLYFILHFLLPNFLSFTTRVVVGWDISIYFRKRVSCFVLHLVSACWWIFQSNLLTPASPGKRSTISP